MFAAYAKLTGQQAIIVSKPEGVFKPRHALPERELTVAEITDTINDALRPQKRLLIRRHMTFLVVSTEKIDWSLVPRIQISELPERGSTELVGVILQVTNMDILDARDEVEKLSGLCGRIVLHKNGLLLVWDTAFNVTRIKRIVDLLNNPEPDGH